MSQILSSYHTPDTIKNHPDMQFYRHIWLRAHAYNQMYTIIIIGRPGKGKSWLSMAFAELLDRSEYDKPRFDSERVYFTTLDFIEGIKAQRIKGTVHVMDDAGLNIYRRDAMSDEVKKITKVAQSMRYKNPIVIYNLPDISMLDSNIVKLADILVTVTGYDKTNKVTNFKIQHIKTYPNNRTIYYPYPVVDVECVGGLGLTWTVKMKRKMFKFRKANEDLIKAYEARKKIEMNKIYEEMAKSLKTKKLISDVKTNIIREKVAETAEKRTAPPILRKVPTKRTKPTWLP